MNSKNYSEVSKMTKENCKPSIRFAGFNDAWEQRKAIDIADYSKGNGYSKGNLIDIGTPIILYGRLYTKYQFAISEVDTFAVPRNGAVYSQGNEVIVPASGETAEDIARASAIEKSGILLGGDLNILRPFDFINPLFLALAISNGEPQKELAKKAQGKSVVHIHNTDIQEVTIVYPSKTEQDRIVSVFRQLDNLITLHQRKYDKLTTVKKSMLEKMFPKNGYNVPEIRFKGFTDAWEQRKLLELVMYRSSSLTVTDAKENGKYYLYDANSIIGNTDIEPIRTKYITIIKDGAGVGRIRQMPENTMFIGTMGALIADRSELNFIFALLTRFDLGKTFSGSTIPHIYFKDYGNNEYLIPNKIEQEVIGDFFHKLDNLITLHQRKLEKLKNIKKACLEKMFV